MADKRTHETAERVMFVPILESGRLGRPRLVDSKRIVEVTEASEQLIQAVSQKP